MQETRGEAGGHSVEASAAAEALADVVGEALYGVIFFGSRKSGTPTDEYSAYDLFVVTSRGYLPLYRRLRSAGLIRRPPLLSALLNAVMPPNQISLKLPTAEHGTIHAKCSVISQTALARETSQSRHDHFCAGRLFQPAEVAYARDSRARSALVAMLESARRLTLGWGRPFLPASFDVETYCQSLLRFSLGQEIRPEPMGRADQLFASQRRLLLEPYAALLAELADSGDLSRVGDGRYALARPTGGAEQARHALFFRWSKVRATARWAKYIVTYEGWLDYIIRKVRRHSGLQIALVDQQRRWPVVFLWPELLRYLRTKDARPDAR